MNFNAPLLWPIVGLVKKNIKSKENEKRKKGFILEIPREKIM